MNDISCYKVNLTEGAEEFTFGPKDGRSDRFSGRQAKILIFVSKVTVTIITRTFKMTRHVDRGI